MPTDGSLLEALALGGVAQSSLLLAGMIVCWITVPRRLVGALAGFGAGAMVAALAAGGLLAMITNSLIPFAYERGGLLAGVATVFGFCLSLGSS